MRGSFNRSHPGAFRLLVCRPTVTTKGKTVIQSFWPADESSIGADDVETRASALLAHDLTLQIYVWALEAQQFVGMFKGDLS